MYTRTIHIQYILYKSRVYGSNFKLNVNGQPLYDHFYNHNIYLLLYIIYTIYV